MFIIYCRFFPEQDRKTMFCKHVCSQLFPKNKALSTCLRWMMSKAQHLASCNQPPRHRSVTRASEAFITSWSINQKLWFFPVENNISAVRFHPSIIWISKNMLGGIQCRVSRKSERHGIHHRVFVNDAAFHSRKLHASSITARPYFMVGYLGYSVGSAVDHKKADSEQLHARSVMYLKIKLCWHHYHLKVWLRANTTFVQTASITYRLKISTNTTLE